MISDVQIGKRESFFSIICHKMTWKVFYLTKGWCPKLFILEHYVKRVYAKGIPTVALLMCKRE